MTDKSIADVLDNTVNKLSDGVKSLGNAIQKIAPDAWNILVHQQKALAIQQISLNILFLVLIFIAICCYKHFVYNAFSKYIEQDKDFIVGQTLLGILVSAVTIGLIVCSLINLSDGLVRYNTAEYYAAKDALNLVKQ